MTRPIPRAVLDAADQALVDGVLARNTRALAKAITLAESSRRDHQARARAVLDALLPYTGNSIRVGISGAPGVGKSTFVEALGLHLIARAHRVAVLAVDPSSSVTGGSILGDKTRMEQLSQSPQAYIRPSPSGGSLGGVAEKTREALLVCEAAGHDVIVVETVGVGQSETAVAGMVDVFVLLQLPHAGDELQAIKKGIVEIADLVVINKADLDARATEVAQRQMQGALDLLRHASPHWKPAVLAVSALANRGIEAFWREIGRHRDAMRAAGEFEARRRRQALDWMWSIIDAALRSEFRHHPAVKGHLPPLTRAVAAGTVSPAAAAHRLLDYLHDKA